MGEGIELQGKGQTVTENFSVPKCAKSVFMWSVEPNPSGVAAVILLLHNVQAGRESSLVNALDMDITSALEGEALESVSAGVHFLVVDNATGTWSVKWECRD
jgi:hypothetical protein